MYQEKLTRRWTNFDQDLEDPSDFPHHLYVGERKSYTYYLIGAGLLLAGLLAAAAAVAAFW